MAVDLAYVNGRITPVEQAVVPALDRGFLYGDACYEVVRVYAGVPWHLDEHLERLERSATGLRMPRVPPRAELARIGEALFASSGYGDGRLYYQLTRGVGRSRSEAPGADLEPTLVVMAESFQPPSEAVYAKGVKAITVPEARWERSDYKTTNLMPRILVRMEAQAHGAYEALWCNAQGCIREGTVTNFFAVKERVIVTHALEPGVVPGVTRREVLAVASDLGLPVSESAVALADLPALTEAFLTGTTPEVLAVVEIDGVKIGDGTPGPVTRALHAGYRERVRRWVNERKGYT